MFISVDGMWGSWSTWTDCDAACGNGQINRTRDCDNPAPQHGGAYCTGLDVDNSTCWNGTCYPSVIGNLDRVRYIDQQIKCKKNIIHCNLI